MSFLNCFLLLVQRENLEAIGVIIVLDSVYQKHISCSLHMMILDPCTGNKALAFLMYRFSCYYSGSLYSNRHERWPVIFKSCNFYTFYWILVLKKTGGLAMYLYMNQYFVTFPPFYSTAWILLGIDITSFCIICCRSYSGGE